MLYTCSHYWVLKALNSMSFGKKSVESKHQTPKNCEFKLSTQALKYVLQRGLHGWFRLQWRSAPIKIFRGMEQYDWLQSGLFIGQGLHYGQDFSGGELQAWMENDMIANMATHFAKRVLQRSSFLGNPKSLDKKLDLWGTPTWGIVFTVVPSCPPQLLLSWANLCTSSRSLKQSLVDVGKVKACHVGSPRDTLKVSPHKLL